MNIHTFHVRYQLIKKNNIAYNVLIDWCLICTHDKRNGNGNEYGKYICGCRNFYLKPNSSKKKEDEDEEKGYNFSEMVSFLRRKKDGHGPLKCLGLE